MKIFAWLNKLGGREKAWLAAAGAAFLALAVDRLVAQPLVRRHQAMCADIEAVARQRLYAEAVLQRKDDVTELFGKVESLLSVATEASVDVDTLKGQIDDLAKQCGLLLLSMKHREPRVSAAAVEYLVDIGGFEGTKRSLLAFLDAVQRSAAPGMLRVAAMTVTPGRGEGVLKGSMLITKLVMAPQESGAAAGGAAGKK